MLIKCELFAYIKLFLDFVGFISIISVCGTFYVRNLVAGDRMGNILKKMKLLKEECYNADKH